MRTKFKKERTINHNKGWGCVVAQPLNTSKRCKRCGRGGESGSHKNKNKTCDSCIFVNYRNSLLSIILASSPLHSSLVLCERTLVRILYYQPMNIDPFVLPLRSHSAWCTKVRTQEFLSTYLQLYPTMGMYSVILLPTKTFWLHGIHFPALGSFSNRKTSQFLKFCSG